MLDYTEITHYKYKKIRRRPVIKMIRLVLLNSFIKKGNSKINQRIFAKEIRQIVIIAPERFLPVIQCPLKQK
jgi:hypothetical protein